MIPRFLRPEIFSYASVVPAPPVVTYLIHVRHPNGVEQEFTFTTASARGYALIPMVRLPVDIRTSEVTSIKDVA